MKRLEAFLLLSIIIFCFEEGVSQSRQCRTGYAANEKILVVISFDGLKFDYINSTNTPYLASLRDKGARTSFWTLRFANALNVHQTIATGVYPSKHGVVSHEWFEKVYNKKRKLQTYERSQYENRYEQGDDVIPIWTLNDLHGGTSACMMWPGCEFDYGPDKTHPTYIHTFSEDETYESRLQQIITWMNESATFNPPNLVMIYFRQPDHFAHVYGPNSPKIIPKLKELDDFTKNFTDKLKQLPFTRLNKKLFPSVNFVFVSDHRLYQIFYEDILDIPAQGECSDVKFYGSDVWLQYAYTSRENNTNAGKKLNGDWSCKCTPEQCRKQGIHDFYRNWDNRSKYYVWPYCWSRTYNKSKCMRSMRTENLPPHYLINPYDKNFINTLTGRIANFTFIAADINHTWSLRMDEAQKLVFAAYGEKLYPKIDKWRQKYNFSVNECTKFGVHGYAHIDFGYFIGIGPAFVKNLKSRGFQAVDLYSLFAKVLGFPKTYHNDGSFWRVRHLLISSEDEIGTGLVNWLQHLKLIVICSIIHCAVFFIAVEIYLARQRNRNILRFV